MKKIIFTLFVLIIFNLNTFADEIKKAGVEQYGLSFEQAYELMLTNNNQLKMYNEMIKEKKYEKNAALGEFSPKVGLNATYMHFNEDSQLHSSVNTHTPFGILGASTTIQEQNVFGFGGSAVWNIFTGGKLLSNHAAARAKLEASNEKYKEVKDTLTLELVKRYYGLILATDVLKVRKQVKDGIEQHLKEAKLLEKEGIISKSERLHAQVAYSDALRDYKAALCDVNIVQEGLKALIKADEANLEDVYVEPTSALFINEENILNLNEIRNKITENNPQMKQLKAKQKALDAKYHAKMAAYSPNVSLVAYDIAAASHLSEAMPRFGIGGMVNMPLFDGFARLNNVKAAGCERRAVAYEIKDAQYSLETLATKQYEELMKNRETYLSANNSFESAQEALRTANLAFKEGFGTSLQVTDAQMMLSKVKIDKLNAMYQYDVALCELLKTNGNTNEILNYIKTAKQEKL